MEPPEKVIDVAPPVGAKVPPQVLVVVTGDATVIAAGVLGNVSLNATAVIAVSVPLVKVKESVETCPSCTGVGLNCFAILGTPTARTALALVPEPAFDVVTAPVLFV